MTQAKAARKHYLDVGRHPDFDLFWEGDESKGIPEHYSVCCRLARAAARKINGDWRDCLGPMVLLMNKALFGYDPSRGSFAKYFGNYAVKHVVHYFTKKDSMSAELSFQHISSARRCALRGVFPLDDVPFDRPEPGPAEDDLPDWEELMAPLNKHERRAITLYYRDDETYEEIGRKMGRSRGAVSQLLFSGRTKIREAM